MDTEDIVSQIQEELSKYNIELEIHADDEKEYQLMDGEVYHISFVISMPKEDGTERLHVDIWRGDGIPYSNSEFRLSSGGLYLERKDEVKFSGHDNTTGRLDGLREVMEECQWLRDCFPTEWNNEKKVQFIKDLITSVAGEDIIPMPCDYSQDEKEY